MGVGVIHKCHVKGCENKANILYVLRLPWSVWEDTSELLEKYSRFEGYTGAHLHETDTTAKSTVFRCNEHHDLPANLQNDITKIVERDEFWMK